MSSPQAALPFDTPISIVEAAFLRWIDTDDGKTVEADCTRRAHALRARGFKRVGIALIWEAARYDQFLRVGPDAEGWKLNNSYRSFMARRIMAEHPELVGFFEVRELRGRAWRKRRHDA